MSFLDDRRRGAEEAFFAKQNEELRVQLRTSPAAGATHQELTAASGLTNDAVLETLKGLNVGPEGAAAVSLIPLVAVAWADGEMSGPERDALLKAAAQAGLEPNSPGYRLFSSWLAEAPPSRLMARWKEYAQALASGMAPSARDAFRTEILGKARSVAAAAGGFLGLNTVSAAEDAVIREIEASL